jgi:hypothetical protein
MLVVFGPKSMIAMPAIIVPTGAVSASCTSVSRVSRVVR